MNLRNDLSYERSASFVKKHAGNSLFERWYDIHSQQIPFRLQGSYVQLHF